MAFVEERTEGVGFEVVRKFAAVKAVAAPTATERRNGRGCRIRCNKKESFSLRLLCYVFPYDHLGVVASILGDNCKDGCLSAVKKSK